MTTLDMSRPQLGVLEAASVAQALTLLGFGITGGGEFRQSASDIRQHPGSDSLPIISADASRAGMRAWLTKQAAMGCRVVILRGGEVHIPADLGVSVQLPATVNDIMAAAGWGPSPHPIGAAVVHPDFSVDGIAPVAPVYLQPAPVVVEEAAAPALPPAPEPVIADVVPALPVEVAAPTAGDPLPLPDWAAGFAIEPVAQTAVASAPAPVAPPAAAISIDSAVDDEGEWPTLAPPVPSSHHHAFEAATPSMTNAASVAEPELAPTELPEWALSALAAQSTVPAAAVPAPVASPAPAFSAPAQPAPIAAELPAVAPAPVSAPMPIPAPQEAPAAPVNLDDFASMVSAAQSQHNAEVASASPRGRHAAPSAEFEPAADNLVAAPVAAPEQVYVAPAIPVVSAPIPEMFQQPSAPPAADPAPVVLPVAPVVPVYVEQAPVIAPAISAPIPEMFQQPAPVATPVPAPVATADDPSHPDFWRQSPSASEPAVAPAPAFVPPANVFHVDESAPAAAAVAEHWAPGQAALLNTPESQRARVLVCFAGKGGVGKTSSAILLAQRAAEAGLRVAVVDMNRGQGDIRSYLRLDSQTLPTIYNAAITGVATDAIITPDQINASRHPSLPTLGFAVVLAPPPDFADPAIVTPEVYGGVLALLQQKTDLVIVDTQITEARDTSGLIDRVVVPALSLGAFGFGLTDMSKPGMENLLARTRDFITRGVLRDRLMLAVNKASGFDVADRQMVERRFSAFAHFVGTIGEDSKLADSLNAGHVDTSPKSVRPLLDRVLLQVTGLETFDGGTQRRSIFGRRR